MVVFVDASVFAQCDDSACPVCQGSQDMICPWCKAALGSLVERVQGGYPGAELVGQSYMRQGDVRQVRTLPEQWYIDAWESVVYIP